MELAASAARNVRQQVNALMYWEFAQQIQQTVNTEHLLQQAAAEDVSAVNQHWYQILAHHVRQLEVSVRRQVMIVPVVTMRALGNVAKPHTHKD